MRLYTLEVIIDGENVGVHEKADGLQVRDLRIVSSILEEYKIRMINAIIASQQITDLKKAKKAE